MKANCTFHSFRESGKWYATGRGFIDDSAFSVFVRVQRRDRIVELNGGKFPGLSGPGSEFIHVVIPDEDAEGRLLHPLLLTP